MKYIIYDKTGQIERCTTHKLEYNGEFMGPCSVMCTIKSSEPINFEIGDYLVYRGERFEINYDPSIVKKCSRGFSDEAFIYDSIKFNSLSDELTRCDFLDYTLNDNQIHFTALPRFSFYASSVKDLADRIQANLDRVYKGESKWNVSVNPEFTGKTNVNVDISNLNVWEALALAYNTFNAHFVIKGRNITIGTSGMTADHLFQYGKGNGLKEIERQAEQDQLIVTRLRVYGSTKNLPNRYYNKLTRPDGSVILPDNMAVQNLMLPGFPITTLDPYVDSRNITKLGIREHTIYFDGSEEGLDEIYPSLEGMTAEQLRDAGVNIELDAGDNGKLDEIVSAEQIEDNGILPEEGELKKTFILTLKDIGFDINKYLTTETAVISMKDGACGAREFEIVKCEKKGNKYELTCNRSEDSSIGRVFPYKDYNIKKGDRFVLLHISMPDVYINAASQRMKKASDEWLKKHDFVRYSYFPKVDDIFMARQHDEAVSKGTKSIHDTLKEGDLMLFGDTDLGIDGAVIIDTLNIKEGEGLIPKYSVVLKDEKTVGTIEKIQQAIESIASGGAGGGYNLEQIIAILKNHGAKMFLRKDQPDATSHLVSLLAGALFGNYSEGVSGAKIDERGKSELADLVVRGRVESPHYNPGLLGSGYVLKYDKDSGRSYMEVDELAVRMKAVFAALEIRKLTYAGGNWVFSAAGAKCTRVEEFGGYYRCFFTAEYGSQRVENEFRVDDQVRYQEGNFALGTTPNASNHFGWRKVVGLGEDYIDLSKTDCMANSDAPVAGDDLVQLGNRTDAQRQNAIVISAYGEGSPSITQHKGINSYSLAGTEKTRISPQKNVFTGELHFESGVNVEEQVGSQGEQILEALEQAAENNRFANAIKKDVDAIKNQVDGIIETWFLDPVPTLSNKPAVDWTTDAEKKKHIGDMYYDANGKAYRFSDRGGKYQWETITDSDIIKALEAAKKAQDTADGKRRVFVEAPSLSSIYDVGDLWVNATYASYKNELLRCKTAKKSGVPFDISHWEKACKYTDDTVANNAVSKAEQAKKDAEAAKNEADAANANANKANALLSDIANDNKLTAQEKQQTKKEWDIILSEKPKNDASADRYGVSKVAYGTAYASLSAYITPLLDSLTTTSNIVGADFRGKFKAYYDARTDLLNAISAKTKEIADAAQSAADAAAQKAQQALEQVIENKNFANAIKKDLDALKNQVDGVIETWFFDPVPTLTNQPAVNWNTTEEKQKHIGDLYYDKNGKAYRFSNRGGTFQWEVLADSDVAKALEAAKKAQDTADGKRRVFVAVPTTSNAYDVGDLWVNATYGSYVNELLKCKTAKSGGAAFSISHWEKACKYTDDTVANAAVQKAQQAKEAADVAQNSANKAKQDAVQALDKLTEIADDNKFTASEKQQTKKEWDIIVSEKPKYDASADRYGVSKAAYETAYNSLSAYITPLLATLTTTSSVVGTDFRRYFKAYYDARTDLLNSISSKAKELADRAQQEAGQAASKAEQAKADAAAAQSKANSAHSVADAAKNRLSSWAADNSISPVEKQALKEEIARIDADKADITAQYGKYSLGTPTTLNNAHSAYRATLVSLTATSPETIAIPGTFATQQKAFYNARTACLQAIADAAKNYANSQVNALRSETKASINALNDKISLKVDSVTFNSLKQQVQTQGSELQLAKDAIKTKVSQSTFDEQREKQNILAACTDANMITDDPSFARGMNGIIVYNNADNGAVTITRKVGCGVNSSNYYLDIATAATGPVKPGYGGFTFNYQTKARLRLVCRFSAWLDKGRRFEFATNAIGDNSRHFWLTDNQGRGTWADYAYYAECGTGGSFATTFFFYVMGGGRPVSTRLSYATIHMLSADADFKHRISTAETKITQTANSISLKADKSYVDGINNRLSSAEIALNPDQIWMKVSEKVNGAIGDRPTREEIKSGIGVTAGGVTVFGKTISLNGVVTFSSLASDAQGKINTAQNTANNAQNTANTARSEKITLARLEGTVIDGGYIKTSLINVKSLFAEEITATKFNLAGGSIGGFTVNSGYLGLNQTSSATGMSLYPTGVYFRSPNKKVFLGTEMSAFQDQLLHLEDTTNNYLPHVGIKFTIKGANPNNNNFAFMGQGHGVLNGFIEGYRLNYIAFPGNNNHLIINLMHGKYVEVNGNYSDCHVYLPRLSNVREALGITSGDFAVRLTIVHRAGNTTRLWGRRNYSVGGNNFGTGEFPWLRDNGFGNAEFWELKTGDCVEVLLTFSINEYNAYTVNIHR